MNKKRKIILTGLLFAMLILSSCGTLESTFKKVTDKENSIEPAEEKEVCISESEYDRMATKKCEDPNSLVPGKITYFFEGTGQEKDALSSLLDYAEDFVYCSFPSLEDDQIAQQIIVKNNKGLDVKIMFDKLTSFDRVGGSYLPKVDSKYNDFLAENIDLKATNTLMNFCATEDGVFISNNNFHETALTFSVVFFDSPESTNKLGLIYKRQFDEKWWE